VPGLGSRLASELTGREAQARGCRNKPRSLACMLIIMLTLTFWFAVSKTLAVPAQYVTAAGAVTVKPSLTVSLFTFAPISISFRLFVNAQGNQTSVAVVWSGHCINFSACMLTIPEGLMSMWSSLMAAIHQTHQIHRVSWARRKCCVYTRSASQGFDRPGLRPWVISTRTAPILQIFAGRDTGPKPGT
jgi:hypothetical protein